MMILTAKQNVSDDKNYFMNLSYYDDRHQQYIMKFTTSDPHDPAIDVALDANEVHEIIKYTNNLKRAYDYIKTDYDGYVVIMIKTTCHVVKGNISSISINDDGDINYYICDLNHFLNDRPFYQHGLTNTNDIEDISNYAVKKHEVSVEGLYTVYVPMKMTKDELDSLDYTGMLDKCIEYAETKIDVINNIIGELK